jgi:hypothetical protein
MGQVDGIKINILVVILYYSWAKCYYGKELSK